MSHATACPMQLVLCNYTNLQLHATVAKLKISSSENNREIIIKNMP